MTSGQGRATKKSKLDHFINDCATSTRQSTIPNEDIDWDAIETTEEDFAKLATSTPPGLGRGVLRRPETPGRVRSHVRGIYALNTPSPTPGQFDDIDPWERGETSSNDDHHGQGSFQPNPLPQTTPDHGWGTLSSRQEPPIPGQLTIGERVHEATTA
jgi:hypothetical protein